MYEQRMPKSFLDQEKNSKTFTYAKFKYHFSFLLILICYVTQHSHESQTVEVTHTIQHYCTRLTASFVVACAAKRRQWLGEEMHGVWSRGSKTKRKTKEDLERGYQRECQARKLNTEDAMDRSKWSKLIKKVRRSGWVWVGEFSSGTGLPE